MTSQFLETGSSSGGGGCILGTRGKWDPLLPLLVPAMTLVRRRFAHFRIHSSMRADFDRIEQSNGYIVSSAPREGSDNYTNSCLVPLGLTPPAPNAPGIAMRRQSTFFNRQIVHERITQGTVLFLRVLHFVIGPMWRRYRVWGYSKTGVLHRCRVVSGSFLEFLRFQWRFCLIDVKATELIACYKKMCGGRLSCHLSYGKHLISILLSCWRSPRESTPADSRLLGRIKVGESDKGALAC